MTSPPDHPDTIVIDRSLAKLTAQPADLAIVGGGIYGVMLLLEASRRGKRAVLVEKDDFGGAVSWNSLRIIHGGLRYLQSLDLTRFRESVGERRWFLQHMPDLVRPMPCLMPLYGEGLKRPSIFRAALLLNDLLGARRNQGVAPEAHLPGGSVLSTDATRELFPQVRSDGLCGSGKWWDAVMVSQQRLMMELIRWAVKCGGVAANYTQAESLETQGGAVSGLVVRDRESGETGRIEAKRVVSAAGPWCEQVASQFSSQCTAEYHPTIAFNLMLDLPPLSDHAVAVTPPRPGARTYFLIPWEGKTFAGTYHAQWSGDPDCVAPSAGQIAEFLADLREAVPGLSVGEGEVVRAYAGIQPADHAEDDEPGHRPRFVDHASQGGPRGFFTSHGVKYTTARLVAERSLAAIFPGERLDYADSADRPPADELVGSAGIDSALEASDYLVQFCSAEAVCHVDDLLLRRTDWGGDPRSIERLAQRAMPRLGWGDTRIADELARLAAPAAAEAQASVSLHRGEVSG